MKSPISSSPLSSLAAATAALFVVSLPLTYGLVLPFQAEQPLIATSELLEQGHGGDGFLEADPGSSPTYRIPTVHESAVQARRILQLESIGTLSTVFPASASSSSNSSSSKDMDAGSEGGSGEVGIGENRPPGLGGMPIGLMEYFAACEEEQHPGDPTLLAIGIATSFKNEQAGSNITLSLRWHPPDGGAYSYAALPRFALVGYLERLTPGDVHAQAVGDCFARQHPDARLWFPGNQIHESKWVRLVVQHVYWIGGFGDRAYIGWIPVQDWRSVTRHEIASIRLPGET